MADENVSADSLSDTMFSLRERKRPFSSPNFHEDTLAAALNVSLSVQKSLEMKDDGNVSGSLSDTAFKPRERKRLFEKPNYHENTLAAEFSNVHSSDQESFVLPVRPRNLLKEKNCDLTFTASQSKDNSVVSMCSFKKKSKNGRSERIQPNFDVDQSFNETFNQSVYSLSKSSKQTFRFNAPPDLTFGGLSSLEATTQESSCTSSGNRSSTTFTNSNFESSSLSSTDPSNDSSSKTENSSNFCADKSASPDMETEKSDDESLAANVTLTDPSFSQSGSNSTMNVPKSPEMQENDINSEGDSECPTLSVSDQSTLGENDLVSISRLSRFRNTGNTFTKNDTSDLTDIPVITPEKFRSSPATPVPVTEKGVSGIVSYVHDVSKISESNNHDLTYTISAVRETSIASPAVISERVAESSTTENNVPNSSVENIENVTLSSRSSEPLAKVDGNNSVRNIESMTTMEASQEIDLGLNSDSHLPNGSIHNSSHRASNDHDICESQESVVLLKSVDRQKHRALLENRDHCIDFSINSSQHTLTQTSEANREYAPISQDLAEPGERRKHLDLLKSPNHHIDFNVDSTPRLTGGDEENGFASQESIRLCKTEERQKHIALLKRRTCHLDFDVNSSQNTTSRAIADDGDSATVSQESVMFSNDDGRKKASDLLRDKRCSINFSVNQSQNITLSETIFNSRKRFQFDAARADDLTFSMPASQQSAVDTSSATYRNLSALVEEESVTSRSGENTSCTSSVTFEIVEPSQLESAELSEVEVSKSRLSVSNVSDCIRSQIEVLDDESCELESTLKPEEDVVDPVQLSCDVSGNQLPEDTRELEEDVIDLMRTRSNVSKSESRGSFSESEPEVEEDVIDLMLPQSDTSKDESHELSKEDEDTEYVVDLMHPRSDISKVESHELSNEGENTEDVVDLMHPRSDTPKDESHELSNEGKDVEGVVDVAPPRSIRSKNESQKELERIEDVVEDVPSKSELDLETDVIDLMQPENNVPTDECEPEENVIDLLQPRGDDNTDDSGHLSRFIQSESRIQTFSESPLARGESNELRSDTLVTDRTTNTERLSHLIVSESDMESSKLTSRADEIQDGTRDVDDDASNDDRSRSTQPEIQKLDSMNASAARKLDSMYTVVDRTNVLCATHVTGQFESLVNVSYFDSDSVELAEKTLVPTPQSGTSAESKVQLDAESLTDTYAFRDVEAAFRPAESLLVTVNEIAKSVEIETETLPEEEAAFAGGPLIGHSYCAPPRPEMEFHCRTECHVTLEVPEVGWTDESGDRRATKATESRTVPKRRSSRLQARRSKESEQTCEKDVSASNEVGSTSIGESPDEDNAVRENVSPNQSASTSRTSNRLPKRKSPNSDSEKKSSRLSTEEYTGKKASLTQSETPIHRLSNFRADLHTESGQWESGINMLAEEREMEPSFVPDNDWNSPKDIEGLPPAPSDALPETPLIPALKTRRSSRRRRSSQNDTKRPSTSVPSVAAPSMETPIVTSRKSARLSKRKSPDSDGESGDVSYDVRERDSVKGVGVVRKSTRLSTKAGFSVRFVDTVHSISTIEGSAAPHYSVSEKSEPPCATHLSQTFTKSSSSHEPSLINKLFAKKDAGDNDDNVFARPTSTAPKKKKRADRSDQLLSFAEDAELKALPRKPNFPRLADYIHKGLYDVLIEKMRAKYGIETNAKVVALAHSIKSHVDLISNSEEHYPEEAVKKFKRLLARQQIVETNYDFWFFTTKRFPGDFRRKAFPLFVFKDGKRQLRDESACFDRILSNENEQKR